MFARLFWWWRFAGLDTRPLECHGDRAVEHGDAADDAMDARQYCVMFPQKNIIT